MKTTPSPRLNKPFGLENPVNWLAKRSPRRAMSSKISDSPKTYASKYKVPSAKLTGSTEAKITKYVGEQVENTGPSAAPTITSPQAFFFLCPLPSSLFERIVSLAKPGTFSQVCGKNKVSPKSKRIPPERNVQNVCGMEIKAVEAFSRNVKRIIDAPSEATTIYGVALLRPDADEPITTGNSGRMHGANTVRTPAINAIAKKVMLLYVLYYRI